MSNQVSIPKAFAVWFKDIDRWDVSSFHRIKWHWPKELMIPIGDVLRSRREKVDRNVFKFSELQPITIHFDGSIEKRRMDPNREYTMDLWFARPGDIVVAKIDLKNGAVGIVPPDWENVVVTGHFAVYEPDHSRILPEYFHRIIQTDFFRSYLWRNKVGAEGRKEVKLDFFERELIPLPPLERQKAIAGAWSAAQTKSSASSVRIDLRRKEIDQRFFADLGLVVPLKIALSRCFGVSWADLHRWGVSYNQQRLTGLDISRGKFPVVELRSILKLVQYGTSEKANSVAEGVPIIRMNNIVGGALDLSKLKYVQLRERDISRLLLQPGDILFNRTNSKELVGKCAVFEAPGEFVFASYLIRLRVNRTLANPEFIAYALNSPIGRQQIDAISRQIIGQANVNSEELAALRLPLPPLSVQGRIARWIKSEQAKTSSDAAEAKRRETDMTQTVELMILGKMQPN